jgi:hypothetical protein
VRRRGTGDELVVARFDLDFGRCDSQGICDAARRRRPEPYRLIVERTGAEPAPE